MHGFEVVSASTVTEAISAISSQTFQVLISDLNIGNPGDGFTVVSAMRRTQPDCVTFILTGYPAFETALQAIRNQVDDYLVKPAGPEKLVAAIEQRLRDRIPHRPVPLRRVCDIIRDNAGEIADDIMAAERRIVAGLVPRFDDAECREHILQFLEQLAMQVRSEDSELHDELVRCAVQHGLDRLHRGYSLSMLMEEHRIFAGAIHRCIQSNLLAVDVSHVVPDMHDVNDVMSVMLKYAVESFASASKVA